MQITNKEIKELSEAVDLLALWACCFDYKRFTPEIADKCVEAEDLLNEYINQLKPGLLY